MAKAIVKPKVRGFICITAHPEGCAAHVKEQIEIVQKKGTITNGPKNVLIIGASTGYGLATRIAAAFGSQAATLGVFFERPSEKGRPASAGWYNSVAFENEAHKAGLYAKSINGDAFSKEIKEKVIQTIKEDLGPIDLIIYSLASPRRTDAKSGETYQSVLKPIGKSYTAKDLKTDKKIITETTIEPATDKEITETQKVMGGEDWEQWIEVLDAADLIAPKAQSVAYSYIGPDLTWDIYKNGTIGKAKEHLEASAKKINSHLSQNGGRAFIAVNKAVVTQASSAIPVVPLYISILFKIMKEKGTHEDCIHQMQRMLATHMYGDNTPQLDDQGRLRMDDWEMEASIQAAVKKLWPQVTTENLDQITDFAGYQENFLKLFGFGMEGVNYDQEVELELGLNELETAST